MYSNKKKSSVHSCQWWVAAHTLAVLETPGVEVYEINLTCRFLPSPIDLFLFQLLCTSQRLIKINPAAKLGWNAFSFFIFFFFFPSQCLLTVCKGLENTSSSERSGKRAWNPSRLLVRRDPAGRTRHEGPATNISVQTGWDGVDFTADMWSERREW